MTTLQLIVLALIQGLTEFLPVSSSAHLILTSRLAGWPDQGLVFDVATHFGTLLAVLYYFRSDLRGMLAAAASPVGADAERERRLLGWLLLASIPALLAGGLFAALIAEHLRSVRVIAATTIAFGLLLWWADRRGATDRRLQDMTLRSAVWIGLAQVLALVPGVSRSGITITAGRALGFEAEAAARFSFLLSIPVIAGAGAYGLWRLQWGNAGVDWGEFALGVAVAAVAGWACIAAFLALLRRVGLMPFIIYRLILGVALLTWFW